MQLYAAGRKQTYAVFSRLSRPLSFRLWSAGDRTRRRVVGLCEFKFSGYGINQKKSPPFHAVQPYLPHPVAALRKRVEML